MNTTNRKESIQGIGRSFLTRWLLFKCFRLGKQK